MYVWSKYVLTLIFNIVEFINEVRIQEKKPNVKFKNCYHQNFYVFPLFPSS